MKKKIIFSIILIALIASVVVFAAFIFVDDTPITGKSGNIKNSSSLISYRDDTYKDYRTDMEYKVTFILHQGQAYTQTSDTTYKSGKDYYTKNDETYTKYTSYNVGESISIVLYEQTKSYDGINSIDSVITKSETLDSNKYSVSTNSQTNFIDSITIDDTITLSNFILDTSGIKSCQINKEGYKVVVDSSKQSILILNESKSTYTKLESNNIICRATNGISNESDNYMYLNQLGIKVEVTTEIACYVRVHIQDAWIRTRQYATNTQERYVTKDQIEGSSPFIQTGDNYYYNQNENTIYLKTMITPEKDTNGNFKTSTYIFNVNEGYYYINTDSQTIYEDFIRVELSYSVDIVQANRVKEVWGLDPSKLQ